MKKMLVLTLLATWGGSIALLGNASGNPAGSLANKGKLQVRNGRLGRFIVGRCTSSRRIKAAKARAMARARRCGRQRSRAGGRPRARA
jgi:hypothetical protein